MAISVPPPASGRRFIFYLKKKKKTAIFKGLRHFFFKALRHSVTTVVWYKFHRSSGSDRTSTINSDSVCIERNDLRENVCFQRFFFHHSPPPFFLSINPSIFLHLFSPKSIEDGRIFQSLASFFKIIPSHRCKFNAIL